MIDALCESGRVEPGPPERPFEPELQAFQSRRRPLEASDQLALDVHRRDDVRDCVHADQVFAVDQPLELRKDGSALGERFALIGAVEAENHR